LTLALFGRRVCHDNKRWGMRCDEIIEPHPFLDECQFSAKKPNWGFNDDTVLEILMSSVKKKRKKKKGIQKYSIFLIP